MPVKTRRQSIGSEPTSESLENQSRQTATTSKRKQPKNIQRKKRSRKDSGLEKQKDAEPPKKRSRRSSILQESAKQKQSTQKAKQSVEIDGVKYFENDFVYVRMQVISDEDEMAVQKCQTCNCQIEAGQEEVKSCYKCARLYHTSCLDNENYENQCDKNFLNDETWTCESCQICDQADARNADTLCERVIDGDQSVYLAQIIEFIFENGEQLVRLKWIYLQNQDDSETSQWDKKIYSIKPRKKQLQSDQKQNSFEHCKCVFLGPDPDGVSNEPAATVIRKANVVFDHRSFFEQLKSGCDVFFCVGEFEQKGKTIFAEEDEYEGDVETGGFFSDDSMEDGDYNFRNEKRQSLTPKNTNIRRRSQGGENLRESFIQKFDKVSLNLNSNGDNQNGKIKQIDFLEEAKQNLTLNFHPEELPCRDAEKQKIKDFVSSAINGKNGCLYISGIPGTGKTATVREVIRVMKKNKQFKFEFFEFNGLKLPNPQSFYTQFCEKVCNQITSQAKAQQTIEDYFMNAQFTNRKKNNIVITKIVLVDEIDMLVTKNQQILYNLFQWPWHPHACISVITISNTMDLPERLLPRIQSRLTNFRLNFRPYKFEDIEVIIRYRLDKYVEAYDSACIRLVARKVGTLAGDVRKALELLRRGTELAQVEQKERVSQIDVQNAIEELYADPHLQYVCNASILQKLILASIIVQRQYASSQEQSSSQVANKNKILLQEVVSRTKSYCESYSIKTGDGAISMALMNLEAVGLIVLAPKASYVSGTIKLNAVEENVVFMLKQDSSVQLFATLSV